MRVFVCDNYEKMSRTAADFVAAQLLLKPDSHLGLTAGKTPIGMFAELVRDYKEGRVSFAAASYYNLEEYIGVGKEDAGSCRQYLIRHLIGEVNACPECLLLPDGLAADPDAEGASYDALLAALPDGRLDMQIMGIGADGHIGCNRPQETLHAESRNVDLGGGRSVVAMGLGSILRAKCILLVANGKDKAQAVADMLSGGITTACPATLLQLHSDVIVVLDKDAASAL